MGDRGEIVSINFWAVNGVERRSRLFSAWENDNTEKRTDAQNGIILLEGSRVLCKTCFPNRGVANGINIWQRKETESCSINLATRPGRN